MDIVERLKAAKERYEDEYGGSQAVYACEYVIDELESLRAENAKLKAELASARAEVEAYRNQEPVGKVVDTDMLGTPIVRWQRLPNMAEFLFINQIEVKQK